MKGDISRSTFDPRKHYNGVRMQQGRALLDADWNEQVDILLHLIRTQMADLLGPGAAVAVGQAFDITLVEKPQEQEIHLAPPDEFPKNDKILPDFWIGAGRCYVDGILCENEEKVLFSNQPDFPAAASQVWQPAACSQYLVYLDVWQRHITAIEDPAFREVALGGQDTTTRVKTVWQVKLLPLSERTGWEQQWRDLIGIHPPSGWNAFERPSSQHREMTARRMPSKKTVLENRLYRVEIHTVDRDQVTFKWSRENGSIALPVTAVEPVKKAEGDGDLRVSVKNLDNLPDLLQEGCWVELADDHTVLNGIPLPLCRVAQVDRANGKVTLQADEDKRKQILGEIGERKEHLLLRRWENVVETKTFSLSTAGDQHDGWLNLENGIQVAFSGSGDSQPGDYWLIPARIESENGIIWPQQKGGQPQGPPHCFAPLAMLQYDPGGWSACMLKSPAFQTLPQITANLSKTRVDLSKITADYSKTEEDLREVPSRLGEVEGWVQALEMEPHGFRSSYKNLQETVDRLESKIGEIIMQGRLPTWVIAALIGMGLLLTYFISGQIYPRQQDAAKQANINANQTTIAQQVTAIQQGINTSKALETTVAQQADAIRQGINTSKALETTVARQVTAIQQADAIRQGINTSEALETTVAQQADAIRQANEKAQGQQVTIDAIRTEVARQANTIQQVKQMAEDLQWKEQALEGSISAVSWGLNRIDIFIRGSDAALWQMWWDGSRWHGWVSLGEDLIDGPTVISRKSGELEVYFHGVDHKLYKKTFNGNSWSKSDDQGISLTSSPAAAVWGDGIAVFERDKNQILGYTQKEGTNFSSWGQVSWLGKLVKKPAVVSRGDVLDVFFLGTDNRLNVLSGLSKSGGWSAWRRFDGELTSSPAAVSWGVGRLAVFARGKDRDLLYWQSSSEKWYELYKLPPGENWDRWVSLGGILNSAPAVSSWGENRMDVFVRGELNKLFHIYYWGNRWSNWEDLGFLP